jgi:hypothetical protein
MDDDKEMPRPECSGGVWLMSCGCAPSVGVMVVSGKDLYLEWLCNCF